ncbi:MAG: hypothetical protein WAT09_04390 [Paracoccaceae bacterium]
MKRLFFLALLVCGPAFANDRADSEAKLAALSDQVIALLQTVEVNPDGIVCSTGKATQSPMYLTVLPTAQLICRWGKADEETEVTVGIMLSPSGVVLLQDEVAKTQKLLEAHTLDADQFWVFGLPVARGLRTSIRVIAVPSPKVAIIAVPTKMPTLATADVLDPLAETLVGLNVAEIERQRPFNAYLAALADHRTLLTGHRLKLAAMFPPTVNAVDPARIIPAQHYPDVSFFGFEPLVQADMLEAGVNISVTLSTSSFALEAAAEEGRFTRAEVNGSVNPRGIYHDRGRVKVYLGADGLTALIDGRATLMLDVLEVETGADPVAALEAVLAHFAANDFSDY